MLRQKGEIPILEPVARTTLSQSIVNKLVKAIKDGLWRPGSRIPNEKDLASAFSVSRNCIREAIKTLNSRGIVESRPGRGTFLAEDALRRIVNAELIEEGYKNATLADLTEIRILLEAQSAFWAAQRATDGTVRELQDLLGQYRQVRVEDIEALEELHLLFHEKIIALSGNPMVMRLLSSVKVEIDAQRAKFKALPEPHLIDLIRDQEEIIAAVVGRDPEGAREKMESHLNKGFRLLASLGKQGK